MKTVATLAAGLALGLAAGLWYAKPDLRTQYFRHCMMQGALYTLEVCEGFTSMKFDPPK